ncbi:MAG TPA: endonuclease [Bacteroidales bacterium]|nr:endonuclease [Bacteroidales bacterium]
MSMQTSNQQGHLTSEKEIPDSKSKKNILKHSLVFPKRITLFLIFLLWLINLSAQIPAGYYNAATGLTGDNLRSALGTIITNGHVKLSYTPGVWNAYAYTDVLHAGSDTIWDMYSDIPGGTPAYYYILFDGQCGTSGAEGDCYSREHCVANSYWGGVTSAYQYSDLHHLNPCDQYVNNIKSNYPLGETTTPTFTSTNGSKVGNCTYPGYTAKVFEPIDSFKGDFAREWFYMATRYMADMPSWTPSSGSATIWPAIYNNATNNWQPWVINLLLEWNALDPVSTKEIDRNNAIYYQSGQGNRNPYIDHPEYVCLVWGTSCASAPVITNVATSPAIPTSVTPVNVSASITDDGSVSGAILYWGTSPTTLTNSITMAVGTPPTYTTVSTIPAQPVGTTIYYKIVATDNQSNSTTSDVFSYNIPQGEPSNHPTNFTCGSTTAVSIPLAWTDATGAVIPTGYLIKMSSVSFAAITNPVDGTPVSDGPNAINVLPGVQSAAFTGLSSNTAYYFKIFSYSNTGANINYLTSGTIQSTTCMTTAESGCASTVFFDDFNRTTLSPGGTPTMTYTSTMVGSSTASIVSSSYLKIANGTTSGISFVSGNAASFASPYNTTLSNNSGVVTWTFNFKYDRTTNPAGIVSGSYGSTIVLAGSNSTLTSGTGYALVYGNSVTPDPIRLVKYSAGVGTSTNIISSGANDLVNITNYASIKVTYNPSGNNWSLFIRDDGTSAWADPSNGISTQIGSTTSDATYTGTALPAFGFVWSHGATANSTNDEIFDNFKVSVNTSPPAVFDVTGGGSYCSGGSGVVVGLSGSETGVTYQLQIDDVNTGSPVAGTGSAINFGNQTAEGVYTVVASRGSNCTTVMNGSATVIISTSLPVSVSIDASPAGSICVGTSVTFTATPTNGGSTPTYQWKVNGSIVGSNSATYTTSTLTNGAIVTCQLTSSLPCVTGNPATSNQITMVVGPPLTVSVSIAASATTICSGTGITFTATPTNGGIPTYQWKVNGIDVGSNSATYATSTLANGNNVTCVMTSSLTCATGSPATSNTITMTVNPILPVSVNIEANPGTSVCTGASVTFTATPVNGGTSPAYQWKKNGSVLSGETNSTYVTSALVNGDIITCVLTSNVPCPSGSPATSNSITMTVNPMLPASVSIAAVPAGSICTGTSVTFTATPVNGGSSPTYQWKKNGAIVGSNSPTYVDAGLSNNDQIICILTSNATPCLTGSPATSNTITMLVGPPLSVSVSIAATPGSTICNGTSVTYTATPVNGGASPVYQWYLNGTTIGSNSPTYTNSSPADGDAISCVLTSSLSCATGSPATSNTIAMTVNPVLPVSINIDASATTICSGTNVTFTATPANGGSAPAYQWKKNGTVLTGETNATYTTNALVNGDVITCILTSNAICTSGNPATSNIVTMTVNPYPGAAGLISGTATVCQSQYNVAYSVGAIANASGYIWNYSGTGATISGSTNSITIDFSAGATSGVLTVKGVNSCGEGTISANYNITVNPHPDAAGSISGSATVCQGQSGVAYSVGAIANATFYSWTYNGSGATISGSSENITITFDVGATSGTLTVKGSNACGYGTVSSDFPITVTPLPDAAGMISGSPEVCQNQSAVAYSVAAITNANNYTWTYSGTGATINGSSNSITIDFTSGATSGTLAVAGTNACGDGVFSTGYPITVNPILPASVSIAAVPAGSICTGTSVTFTATPANGGTAPTYQWQKNGSTITGETGISYTSATLNNGDVITCLMTSNAAPCLTGSPATSNAVTMVVGPPLEVSVSIAADPGSNVCSGTSVTFSATPVNGGIPTYQWKKNGANIPGETNATYTTSTLVTGDVITCTITSSLTCATGSPATSGAIMMTVNTSMDPTFTQAGPYCSGAVPGMIPSISNNGITGTWSPDVINTSAAGTSVYTFTPNSGQCATGTTMSIVVNPSPSAVTASASVNDVCSGESVNLFSSANSGIYTNTSLISPSGVGGFENGNTFPLNGWTPVNGSFNTWVVGTAAGIQSGTYAAYIGTASNYTGTSNISANHFYRDISIPAGSSNIILNFYCKMPLTDPTTDYLKVYLTTPSYTPVAGTTPGTGYNEVYSNSAAISSYTLQTINLSDALAGSTLRLVITYICDNTNPRAVPAVDNISLSADVPDAPAFSWTSIPGGFSSAEQNPAGVTPATSTQYHVTASNVYGCSSTANTTVTVTTPATPAFSQQGPYCIGDTPEILSLTSLNGITGTWSPDVISTSVAGTTTYTFTPTAGLCATNTIMDVTVNQIPVAEAGIDATFLSTPVLIGDPANGPGMITWSPATGLNNPDIAQPLASPAVTTIYTLTIDNNGCISTDAVTITPGDPGHTISGKTRYAARAYAGIPAPNLPTYNSVNYSIDNVIVILKNYPAGTEVARDTSDALGQYQFSNIMNGEYLLSYVKYAADTMQWCNDVNAADVAILLYFIASDTLADPSRCFAAKYKKAADVDNNSIINAVDVARLKSKIGSPYNVSKNFPHGNWDELNTLVTVAGSDVNINLETICNGDYNASSTKYRDSLTTWSGAKTLPGDITDIIATSEEYVSITDPAYFEIHLRINSKMNEFSALGLELHYPEGYKLTNAYLPKATNKNFGVKINPALEEVMAENNDLLVTDEEGVIRIVYATTNHFDIAANDEVIVLGFRALNKLPHGEVAFKLSGTGVIANQFGEENTAAHLLMPKIFISGNYNDAEFELTGYPNPFKEESMITYNLPENGTVKLKVYNAIGEMVTELVNETQDSGKHSVVFSSKNLPAGMYTFTLDFTGISHSKFTVLRLLH